jgi:hypothetical protein
MTASPLLNAAGRRRSPASLPGYLAGRRPRNKGLRYPPDPPTVEEIVAVMRAAGDNSHGPRRMVRGRASGLHLVARSFARSRAP